jgi:hypothetical protein
VSELSEDIPPLGDPVQLLARIIAGPTLHRLRTMANRGEHGGGAQGRNRTTDTMIFSHVLYQLSYLGIRPTSVKGGPSGGGVIKADPAPVQNARNAGQNGVVVRLSARGA